MKIKTYLRPYLLASLMALPLVCSAEDIPTSALPPKIVAAINAKYPKAVLLSAEREQEHGSLQYEVDIRTNRQKREVHLTEDGKIIKDERDDD